MTAVPVSVSIEEPLSNASFYPSLKCIMSPRMIKFPTIFMEIDKMVGHTVGPVIVNKVIFPLDYGTELVVARVVLQNQTHLIIT